MLRRLIERLRPEPPAPEPTLPTDLGDYIDSRTPATLAGGVPLVKHVIKTESTGFLSRNTFDMVHKAIHAYGIPAETELAIIAKWQPERDQKGPLPMNAADKKDMAHQVEGISRAFGKKQQQITARYNVPQEGVTGSFFTRLQKAAELSGGRDAVDLLQQYGRMAERVKDCFSSEENEALASKEWRTAVIEDVKTFFALRDASQALRREAATVIGEDAMRPEAIVHEAIGSRSTVSHFTTQERRAGMTGDGCPRVNGQSNFGNGFSPYY